MVDAVLFPLARVAVATPETFTAPLMEPLTISLPSDTVVSRCNY